MFTRISSAALLLLAGCSPGANEQTAPADPDDLVECAIAGAPFARECVVEQSHVDGALVLVVRHPDGGFRRFVTTDDGTGLASADGAETASVSLREGGIEVAIGGDRYRLPATIAGDGGR